MDDPSSVNELTSKATPSGVSLHVLGPLAIAGPVLIVVLILTLLIWNQGRRTSDALAREVTGQVERRINARLNQLLQTPRRINNVNARLVLERKLPTDDLAAWRSILREQLLAFDDLGYLTVATPDGRAMWVIRYDDPAGEFIEYAIKSDPSAEAISEMRLDAKGEPTGPVAETFVYDPRQRPWYIAALKRNGPGFSDVFSWQRPQGVPVLGVGFNEPVRDADGELVGVLDAGLSLTDVSRFLKQLDLGQGQAFVIDAEGRLVGSGGSEPIVDSQGNQIAATSSPNPIIREAARAMSSGSAHAVLAAELPGIGRSRIEVTPVGQNHGLPWTIVTVLPESDFMGEVWTARRFTLIAGAICVATALLAGLVLGRRAVQPMLDLEKQVQRIGTGDLDTPVRIGGARELVSLGESLNDMRQKLSDGLRLRKSIEVAMEVQQNLLPNEPPKVRGLDIAGRSIYCDETGGDYFDFIEVAESDGNGDASLILALGDVMGHGVAAALLMTTARAALRSRAREPGSTADLLTHVNDLLVPDTGGTKFMTMALAVVEPSTRTMRWASAGHDAPILYDPSTDTFSEPDGGDLPLGVMADVTYEEYRVDNLAPDTVMIIGTDGIWEAANSAGEQFGKPRLHEVVRANAGKNANDIATAVHDAVEAHAGGDRADDVTLVVVKIAGIGAES